MDGVRSLVLVFLVITTLTSQINTTDWPGSLNVAVPPVIVAEPPQEVAFREGESLQISCVATGKPQPTYRWQIDGTEFDPSGTDGRIAMQPGVGTLIIARPIARDEGLYQCFAENTVGTTITVKTNLRPAYLDPFQSASTRYHRPLLGNPQTLSCIPPRSFPKAQIFWATIAPGESFKPIDFTDRVTIDPEGNLHFLHILQEDSQDGRTYACIVQNTVMRGIQHGAHAVIQPQGQMIQNLPPSIMWLSPTHQVALRGEIWRIKCIFSGSPTPRVDWARLNADMPQRSRRESFGQELVVENVQFEDAGNYECQGINEEAQTPIRRSFDLSVESKPYWLHMPESVNVGETEEATFHCEAEGLPEPEVFWFLNGVPIEKIDAGPRLIVEKNRLTFLNMTKADSQTIQCNATNKHGYIFADAYVNVLSVPPIIQDPPAIGLKVAEGQSINVTCHVFGSPKPLVVWKHDTEELTGERYTVLEDGHLQITNLSLADSGNYTCTATNKHGEDSAVGSLVVRRKTQIQTKPQNLTVPDGTEVQFICNATTDPEEQQNLVIDWKKNGQFIDYQYAQRILKHPVDNSLIIYSAFYLDTGIYTCVASNGVDSDEADAQLIVQATPDPPYSVIVRCLNNELKAEIEWTPGRDNYAPILNYIIQFNTTFTPDNWVDIASNLSHNERRKIVTLSPWGNYTFRMLARNEIGLSYPSEHTRDVCRTEPALPFKNPENVIGEGDLPSNLVIFWKPMPKIEQNGPGFKYILTWQRADISDAVENVYQLDIPEAWHHVIEVPPGTAPYTPYYVSVRATNSLGYSIIAPVKVLGYSGEDVPTVAPDDVTVYPDFIKDTEAVLSWTAVDNDTSLIRGFFRGYRIQFARQSEWPENIHEEDFIINKPYYPRRRIKRQSDKQVTVTVHNLPPFSDVLVQVRVLNKYYAGPASNQIVFKTQEGVPGPPSIFDVTARGSDYFELMWQPPSEPNGYLVGYNISYQTINGLNLSELQYGDLITDPEVTQANLTGLQNDTNYRLYLAAFTAKGSGEPIFLDRMTASVVPELNDTANVNVTEGMEDSTTTTESTTVQFVNLACSQRWTCGYIKIMEMLILNIIVNFLKF